VCDISLDYAFKISHINSKKPTNVCNDNGQFLEADCQNKTKENLFYLIFSVIFLLHSQGFL